jgi:hypothetical protein
MNINGIAGHDLCAVFTFVAWGSGWPLLAIQGLGNQAGQSCLADTTNTTENYRMWNPVPINGILECPNNRLLSDNLFKCLWAPLSGQY